MTRPITLFTGQWADLPLTVVAEKAADRIRVYDLSSRLPVLRTFAPAEVVLTPGASWTHGAAASLYTDAELEAISRYLHWSAGR